MRFITQKNRSILREMVITDFKVRYQGSLLGYTWTVLKPLLLFATLYIVFVKFLRIGGDIPHFPVYLLFGIVLWGFFAETTATAMTSVVGRADLIKKVSIPRYLAVVSGSISSLINFSINLVVVFIFALINGVEPMLSWLLLPVFIFELFVLSTAIGFFLSALYVKYRDASYVWEVLLQAGFYATPVLYPITMMAEKYQKIIMLNPMAQIIQDSRWAFVSHQTVSSWKIFDIPVLFIPVTIVIVVTILSVLYFKSQAKDFAENI